MPAAGFLGRKLAIPRSGWLEYAMAEHRPTPDEILPTYEAVGPQWAEARCQSLFEREWLDRFISLLPGQEVLDIGCGSGQPMAAFLQANGITVTGLDGAASQCALFRQNFPECSVIQADMRRMSLGGRFDGLLAWNSYFHLSQADQRKVIAVFAAHARNGAALMFTSGPAAGEAFGTVAGRSVYHASLDPEEYRSILSEAGFEVLAHRAEDPDCDRHTIWLARYGSLY